MNERKDKVYEYCKKYILEKGYSPSYREICKAVNIPSTSTVNHIIKLLESEGELVMSKSNNKFMLTCLTVIEKDGGGK